MKTIILAIAGIITGNLASAQQISFDNSSVTAGTHSTEYEIIATNNFINNSSDTVFVWERQNVNVPGPWETAVCDWMGCWPKSQGTGEFLLRNGKTAVMQVHFYPDNMPGNGSTEIKVYPKGDMSKAITATYAAKGWGLTVSGTSSTDFTVSPNPAYEVVVLTFDDAAPRHIEILDANGRLMLVNDTESNPVNINVDSLPEGIYFIKVTKKTTGAVTTSNFVKNTR